MYQTGRTSKIMRVVRARWQNFWFEPAQPDNLGLCRALFFAGLFLLYLQQDFSAWSEVGDVFWKPIPVFESLHIPVLPGVWIIVLQNLWKIALGLSCLGLCTRLSTALSFVAGFYLLGLPHNFGKIHRYDAIVVIVLGIMALSRCGDAWSVDRLLRRAHFSATARSGEYTWPIKMVWMTLALVFFGAGVSKLKNSGIAWINSDSLSILLIKHYYHYAAEDPVTRWGLTVARYDRLCRVLAATTVIFEIGYPLAIFSKSARWIIVPVTLAMLAIVRLIMGPWFYPVMLCHLFWVPWDRVALRLRLR